MGSGSVFRGIWKGKLHKMRWKVHFPIPVTVTQQECFWPCSAHCKCCNLQHNLFQVQLYYRRFPRLVNWHQIPSALELFVLIFLTMASLTKSSDGEPPDCWGVVALAAFERAVVMLNIHSGFQTVTMPQSDYTSWSWSSPDLTISPSGWFCVRFEF